MIFNICCIKRTRYDYSWHDRATGDTYIARRDEAINSIRFYYTHIANGVSECSSSPIRPTFISAISILAVTP